MLHKGLVGIWNDHNLTSMSITTVINAAYHNELNTKENDFKNIRDRIGDHL